MRGDGHFMTKPKTWSRIADKILSVEPLNLMGGRELCLQNYILQIHDISMRI